MTLPTNACTLKSRIEEALHRSLTQDVDVNEPIFVIGNGLTRMASDLTPNASGLSYSEWVNGFLINIQPILKHDVSYLQKRGYAHAEILSYAIAEAYKQGDEAIKKAWKTLYDRIQATEPTAIHTLLAEKCNSLLTTNYDDLLEVAALKTARGYKAYAYDCEENKFNTHTITSNDSNTRKNSNLTIYKLHGGFGLTDGRLSRRYNGTTFENWYQYNKPWRKSTPRSSPARGPKAVIASQDQYQQASQHYYQTEVYRALRNLLKNKTVILLGLGFGAGETLLQALLLQAQPASVLSLAVEPSLDPLWKYEVYSNWKAIRVPLGLVASPQSRLLTVLLFLQKLQILKSDEVDEIVECPSQWIKTANNEYLPRIVPLIIAPGQASVNRVLGLENGISQERAYSPAHASSGQEYPSWIHGGETHTKPLSNVEVGGQSLVPCLVWDALSIPCSIAGKIGADDYAEQIINRLSKTTWIDFEWLMKNQSASSVTDNATVVAWFGLRTILDQGMKSNLEISLPTDKQTSAGGAEQECGWPKSPIVYLTKTSYKKILESVWPQGREAGLMVYDTGGRGNADAERQVAERGGIIIASIGSYLEWLSAKEYEPKQYKLLNGKEKEDAIANMSKRAIEWRRQCQEPRDARGRVWQQYKLLQSFEELSSDVHGCRIPWFLNDNEPLSGLRAYVLTAGELGAFFWMRKDGDGWHDPFWCGVQESSVNGVGLDEQSATKKYERYVSGLSCGDVARAGFVASVLSSMGWRYGRLSCDAIQYAVGWLNWFGYHKVRFFALDDFLAFVQKHASDINKSLCVKDVMTQEVLYPNAGNDEVQVKIVFKKAVEDGQLATECVRWKEWLGKFLTAQEKGEAELEYVSVDCKEDPVALWNEEVMKWQKARGF